MHHLVRIFMALIILSAVIGCSNGVDAPMLPSAERDGRVFHASNHQLWGLWRFEINPDLERVDFAPIRSGELHINALSMLEPPAGVYLSIEGAPQFAAGNVTVNIGLTHPADGHVELTGFDVKGILIGAGSISIEDIPQLVFAGDDDIRLLNADGHVRWWNPEEFPYNPSLKHQGYVDGLLGTPHSVGDFTATLNPFKYYCDALGPNDEPSMIPLDSRGYFSAGAKNVRKYIIDFTPSGLVFNYAVDASWMPPLVPPPATQVPDDFPKNANGPEPYRIIVHEIENSLKYNTTTGAASGKLKLDVDIYDWFNADEDFLCGYATHGELDGGCNFWPVGGGEGYSTYQIDTSPSLLMTSADDVLLWIAAECQEPSGYNGKLPFEAQGVYYPYIVPVQEES